MPYFELLTPRLPAQDLPRTIEFYCRLLGFEVDVLWPEELPEFVILKRDGVQLGFYRATRDAQTTGKTQCGGGDLYLEVVDLPDIFLAVKDQVTIEWGPEVYFYGRREFAFRDPDGYLVIFTEPTDDPPTCGEDDG